MEERLFYFLFLFGGFWFSLWFIWRIVKLVLLSTKALQKYLDN